MEGISCCEKMGQSLNQAVVNKIFMKFTAICLLKYVNEEGEIIYLTRKL